MSMIITLAALATVVRAIKHLWCGGGVYIINSMCYIYTSDSSLGGKKNGREVALSDPVVYN